LRPIYGVNVELAGSMRTLAANPTIEIPAEIEIPSPHRTETPA
jgi:hypothetical protein